MVQIPPMKICIDARSLSHKGIYSYSTSLIKSLLKVDKRHEYCLIIDHDGMDIDMEQLDKIIVPSNNPLFWLYWSNLVLPKILNRRRIDVYHSFKHVTAYHLKAKKVLTFHGGPMLYRFPDFYKWYDLLYWKFSYRLAIKTYDRIIATAKAESDFFTDKLAAPASKFRVVNLSGDERFGVIKDDKLLKKVREKFGLPNHFLLFLGRIHPQKNIERMIKAYHLSMKSLSPHHKLVIVGGKSGSYFQTIFSLVRSLDIIDDVIFLGHIPSEDVPVLYNLADVFLFPTNYENWGIVLLEAMACGLPVITSNIPDIDEVVDASVVRVDPADISGIAHSIIEVVNSEEIKASLSHRGLTRVKLFSWDRCARETIGVYEELMES